MNRFLPQGVAIVLTEAEPGFFPPTDVRSLRPDHSSQLGLVLDWFPSDCCQNRTRFVKILTIGKLYVLFQFIDFNLPSKVWPFENLYKFYIKNGTFWKNSFSHNAIKNRSKLMTKKKYCKGQLLVKQIALSLLILTLENYIFI